MLVIPLVMIIFGKQPVTWQLLLDIYGRWGYVVIPAEFLYSLIYFNRGHHGNGLIHQGDEITSYDFGEFQLNATIDRKEANFNLFTTLAYSGEQVFHHLFPTVDCAIIPQLKDTLKQTCKEFDIELRPETTLLWTTWGSIRQLYRSEIIRST